jgi:hypothetical protein
VLRLKGVVPPSGWYRSHSGTANNPIKPHSTQQIGCASKGPFEDIKEHIPRRSPGVFAKVHMRSLVV